MSKRNRKLERGFTLAEMLVVLFMMSLLTILTLNVTGPWLAFKAQTETQQRLENIRTAIESYYDANAYAVVGGAANTFGPFTNVTVDGSGLCTNQAASFRTLGPLLDEGAGKVAMDAYKNSLCVFVASNNKVVDSATLYYKTIAFVSPGQDGVVDPATRLDATTHELTLGGDDTGFVFNGFPATLRKFQVTQDRMARIAKMYEIFFTSRFLANSSRNLSTYYFSGWHDTGNQIVSTAGNWGDAATILAPIGVGADLGKSAWEASNDIQVGNYNETQNGVTVRSPQTGTGFLPYTALIRARLPAPGNAANYAVRVAAGGY